MKFSFTAMTESIRYRYVKSGSFSFSVFKNFFIWMTNRNWASNGTDVPRFNPAENKSFELVSLLTDVFKGGERGGGRLPSPLVGPPASQSRLLLENRKRWPLTRRSQSKMAMSFCVTASSPFPGSLWSNGQKGGRCHHRRSNCPSQTAPDDQRWEGLWLCLRHAETSPSSWPAVTRRQLQLQSLPNRLVVKMCRSLIFGVVFFSQF